jgi:hypothetical protein
VATQSDRDRSLVKWLAENVMGWHAGIYNGVQVWGDKYGEQRAYALYHNRTVEAWNPLTSWADAGMVWEKAREKELRLELRGYADSWEAIWSVSGGPWRANTFSSGPRAICEAVARATGWKEPESEV